MVFTQRERYIAIIVGVVLGLLLFDHFLFTPYLNRRRAIDLEMTTALADKDAADRLFRREKAMRKIWDEMNAGGLRSDPAEAEGQVEHALQDWLNDSGLKLPSIKYERSTSDAKETKFVQISFHATGTGPLSAVSKMLWRVETTSIPLRINEIQLTPRKEGQDDLQLQLSVSTLCRLPDADKRDNNKSGNAKVATAGSGSSNGKGARL